MEPLIFDCTASSYSDASTPRTPSPHASLCPDHMNPSFASSQNFKPVIDMAHHRFAYDPHHDENGIVPEHHTLEAAHMWSSPYPTPYNPPGSRGSLLDELYEGRDTVHEQPPMHYDPYRRPQQSHWGGLPQSVHPESPLSMSMRPHDPPRRNTFPYVRRDHPDPMYASSPFLGSDDSVGNSPYSISRPGTGSVYSEPLSLDGSPHMNMCEPLQPHPMDDSFHPVSHQLSYPDYHPLDGVKTEDTAPIIVPSQQYTQRGMGGMPGMPCLGVAPQHGILVQHTDDAASKETQYLRRRCFNCHTTEPPSWRRSTLNPGKIVCNKCGLYERTHLRPRPLRFDELRAGSKTRKQPKPSGSPKETNKMSPMVKKEPREGEMETGAIQRRSSVSSTTSSVSGGATSDWDENGSAPPSSVGSPASQTFSIPRASQSPPLASRDGSGIRLPNAPLSDIASLQTSPHAGNLPMPRKSATAPMPGYYGGQPQQQDFYRRGSLPVPQERRPMDSPMPEVTGWQPVPMDDLAGKNVKPRKAVIT